MPTMKKRPSLQPYPKVCFSFAAYAKKVIDHLHTCGIAISKGLTGDEFSRIERKYRFTFPPDLRSILSEGLPVGVGFPDWRMTAQEHIKMTLDLPMAGIMYEVSKGRFWHGSWGDRPEDAETAVKLAREFLKNVPVLVPIYSHCYIPSSPSIAGNPVFFIHDTNFHYSGFDVADFFQREVFVPLNFRQDSGEETEIVGRRSVGDDRSHKEKPELAARSAENSPRDGESKMVSRYSYFSNHSRKSPPTVSTINRYTMQAPAWVAKATRRIQFWSDLIEGLGFSGTPSPKANTKEVSVFKEEEEEDEEEDPEGEKEDEKLEWVATYLEEMVGKLRKGGWKEDDIQEMIYVSRDTNSYIDIESFSLLVKSLTEALQKSGWSIQDVVDSIRHFSDRSRVVPEGILAESGNKWG